MTTQEYVLEFTEKTDKVLTVLEKIEKGGISYTFINDKGISLIRVHCGYEGFLELAKEMPRAGLIPSRFTGPKFVVSIQPEPPELQA